MRTGSVSIPHRATRGRNATQKTPPHRSGGGVFDKSVGLSADELLSGALGSLQRVDLLGTVSHTRADMRGQVAIPVFPLGRGLRAGSAIPSRSDLQGTAAPFALLYDFKADATVVSAAFGCHEGTFHAFANRCTFHLKHLP